jgi:class 3 adenylate cyclase
MFETVTPDQPQERELLVAFYDIDGFAKFADGKPTRTIFDFCRGFFDLTGSIVEAAGGKLIKAIGDAGLVAFEDCDVGVASLHQIRIDGERWLADQGWSLIISVKANFGPVTCGYVGAPTDRRLDIYGVIVNNAAMLKPGPGRFGITAALFKKLSPESQAMFGPLESNPNVYVPVEKAGDAGK